MRFPFRLRNPFYRPRYNNNRLYTDVDAPAHEWLQVWTPEQLQAWKDSKAEEWHRMPGAPIIDPNISRDAIPPVEREFQIWPAPRSDLHVDPPREESTPDAQGAAGP